MILLICLWLTQNVFCLKFNSEISIAIPLQAGSWSQKGTFDVPLSVQREVNAGGLSIPVL